MKHSTSLIQSGVRTRAKSLIGGVLTAALLVGLNSYGAYTSSTIFELNSSWHGGTGTTDSWATAETYASYYNPSAPLNIWGGRYWRGVDGSAGQYADVDFTNTTVADTYYPSWDSSVDWLGGSKLVVVNGSHVTQYTGANAYVQY